MKLKTQKLEEGLYSIVGTELVVERGAPARFGNPQEWEICHRDERDWPLLTAKGKARAIDALERLLQACAGLEVTK